ncbi:MAG: dihydroneopterin aldolase [Alphaproteobacteria bacterium]|nr:dihydroneopterin aldolase [Alphaproteobacteria bacterium]
MAQLTLIQPKPQVEPAKPLRQVFVRDFVLACQIGVHRHEQGRKQRVRINVDLAVEENDAAAEDRLEGVVCYEKIVAGCRAIAAAGHLNLVETFAERIAALCLTDTRVAEARIRVEKLDVFADVGSVGVEITRTRSGTGQSNN